MATGPPSLPTLPEISQLSPRVRRILGGNPGDFTLQGTNTYLIGTGKSRILLDSGEGEPVWKSSLEQVLRDEGIELEHLVLTHWHPDHVGGIDDVLALNPKAKVHKSHLAYAEMTPNDIHDGQRFLVEGASLRAVFCPGHTADHMAFVLEEEDAIFTGDNVLGHGTALFEDLAAYMASLELMEKQFSGKAYPGHGEVIDDGRAKIQEYIQHRREREDQVWTLMRKGESAKSKTAWTAMGIVMEVYKGYPMGVHLAAERGVKQIFGKLEKDGKIEMVVDDDDGVQWRIRAGS